jgi:hypothetical protein
MHIASSKLFKFIALHTKTEVFVCREHRLAAAGFFAELLLRKPDALEVL